MRAERLARFRPLVVSALERAGTSLSELAGIQLEVTSPSLELVSLAQVPSAAGSAEAIAGDSTGLRLEVTPLAVVQDMRGAIVDAIVADVAVLGDEALVIGTRFNLVTEGESQAPDVRFLVIPSQATLETLLTRANAAPVAA